MGHEFWTQGTWARRGNMENRTQSAHLPVSPKTTRGPLGNIYGAKIPRLFRGRCWLVWYPEKQELSCSIFQRHRKSAPSHSQFRRNTLLHRILIYIVFMRKLNLWDISKTFVTLTRIISCKRTLLEVRSYIHTTTMTWSNLRPVTFLFFPHCVLLELAFFFSTVLGNGGHGSSPKTYRIDF